ncbi:MAG: hypothetical protein U0L18_07620 [Acutalibacteraceae bacterium]|nr:hypothetical protein [Acutalibacteraceae bacterium]
MTGEEFVELCFKEKESILKEYFDENSQALVAEKIYKLIEEGTSKEALYEIISLVLNENYYNLLIAIDGETQLAGKQICYQLYDEDKNLLNECGEIEEAAYRYFMQE